jgi:pre-mRNA-processing factor 40
LANIIYSAPEFVSGGTNILSSYQPKEENNFQNDRNRHDRDTYGSHATFRGNIPSSFQPEPDFASAEDAEGNFMRLLKRVGVQEDWTWDMALRAAVGDPHWRALKDPKERKIAFEKYIADIRQQEKEKEKERQMRLEADFRTMLSRHPEITYQSRWKTVRPFIEAETVFRSAKSDEERIQIFERYVADLQKDHMEQVSDQQSSALDELRRALTALSLEPYTTWSDVHGMLIDRDPSMKATLDKADSLRAFETHMRSLEQKSNSLRQKDIALRRRRERKARDDLFDMFAELGAQGRIKANTKWEEIFHVIKDDDRLQASLGNLGSNALDIYWDGIDHEEGHLRNMRNRIEALLAERDYVLAPKTPFEEFQSVVRSDRRFEDIDDNALLLIYERAQDKMKRKPEYDKHYMDRNQRYAMDNLRSVIKHLDPPVKLGDTWEDVRPRVEQSEAFRAIEAEDSRRTAFEKFMKRLKEKEEDKASGKDHDRDRRYRERHDRERDRDRHRDRDRDRDRDHRNGHSDSHRRHRLSAEPDVYEEERKKAQVERERSYHRGSIQGLSPPRRDRDERDRYDRLSGGRPSLGSHYDRERREREAERERSYVSRADPRDKHSELDYGDSRAASTRRRRDSDADSGRSTKVSKHVL